MSKSHNTSHDDLVWSYILHSGNVFRNNKFGWPSRNSSSTQRPPLVEDCCSVVDNGFLRMRNSAICWYFKQVGSNNNFNFLLLFTLEFNVCCSNVNCQSKQWYFRMRLFLLSFKIVLKTNIQFWRYIIARFNYLNEVYLIYFHLFFFK